MKGKQAATAFYSSFIIPHSSFDAYVSSSPSLNDRAVRLQRPAPDRAGADFDAVRVRRAGDGSRAAAQAEPLGRLLRAGGACADDPVARPARLAVPGLS